MARKLVNLTRLQHQSGTFGAYKVSGHQFRDQRGEVGWHITAYPGGNPVNDYWVADGVFYGLRIDLGANRSLIEVFDEIQDIDPGEREAILSALAEWDKERYAATV